MFKLIVVGLVFGFIQSQNLFAKSPDDCEKIRLKYFAALNQIQKLNTHCEKDQDCIIIFHSETISPRCDLGISVVQSDAANRILEQLSLLRKEAAVKCPKDEGPRCDAIPYKQAKCSNHRCTGSY